jgi:hypothetical protein
MILPPEAHPLVQAIAFTFTSPTDQRFSTLLVVAVLFHARPGSKRVGAVSWPGKATVTFSDALCAVRRWLWAEAVLPQAGDDTALDKLPERVRELLLATLAPAASTTRIGTSRA